MFFYGYVYEGYYDNNVDRCFIYLSGYVDNGTAGPSLLMTHPEDEFTPLPEWSTQDNAVWFFKYR